MYAGGSSHLGLPSLVSNRDQARSRRVPNVWAWFQELSVYMRMLVRVRRRRSVSLLRPTGQTVSRDARNARSAALCVSCQELSLALPLSSCVDMQ